MFKRRLQFPNYFVLSRFEKNNSPCRTTILMLVRVSIECTSRQKCNGARVIPRVIRNSHAYLVYTVQVYSLTSTTSNIPAGRNTPQKSMIGTTMRVYYVYYITSTNNRTTTPSSPTTGWGRMKCNFFVGVLLNCQENALSFFSLSTPVILHACVSASLSDHWSKPRTTVRQLAPIH